MLAAAYCSCWTLQCLSHSTRQLTALTTSYPLFGPQAISAAPYQLCKPEKTHTLNAIICISIMNKYMLPILYADHIQNWHAIDRTYKLLYIRRQQIWTNLKNAHTVLQRLLHICFHSTRYVRLCLQAYQVSFNNKTYIVMDAMLWERFLTVVVDLFMLATLIPQNNMPVCSNVQSCRNEPCCCYNWSKVLILFYYIGLKLVCDVKDGFWETYIAVDLPEQSTGTAVL